MVSKSLLFKISKLVENLISKEKKLMLNIKSDHEIKFLWIRNLYNSLLAVFFFGLEFIAALKADCAHCFVTQMKSTTSPFFSQASTRYLFFSFACEETSSSTRCCCISFFKFFFFFFFWGQLITHSSNTCKNYKDFNKPLGKKIINSNLFKLRIKAAQPIFSCIFYY